MKVESSGDVQSIQSLERPTFDKPVAPAVSNGVDELAQLFSQEVAANNRTLAQRAISVRVSPAQQLAQVYDQLGHPAQATMASIARRIRMQLLQQPAVDKLLELTGSDPARTFVVLKLVAAEAQAEARKIEAALARDAIAKLEIRFKKQIQAGLNIALALQANCDDPQERQALRSLYYASVVTRQSLASMMHALLGLYGGDRFAAGLKIMRGALADDIAASTSSVPTALLRTLLLGLQSCGQLSGVLVNCKDMIQRLQIEQDAVELMQRMLGYAKSGLDAAEVQRLAGDVWGRRPAHELVALNALYPLVQQLPLAVWLDSRTRDGALQKMLLVMDELARIERGPAQFDAQRSQA